MNGLPAGAEILRDLGEFDEFSAPKGLLKNHSLKEGVWGRLQIVSGSLRFVWEAGESGDQILEAGSVLIIPSVRQHHIEIIGTVEFKLALYITANAS